jgi:predicted nucleic acid-binding protein
MLFIYWLEAHPQHAKQVEHIHRRMSEREDQLCTSVFTLGEILTGVYKAGDPEQARKIRNYFESSDVRLLPFNTETAECYAKIRAQRKVTPADAIHLASASVANVDLYLSNDASLKKLRIEGISFIAGLDGAIL